MGALFLFTFAAFFSAISLFFACVGVPSLITGDSSHRNGSIRAGLFVLGVIAGTFAWSCWDALPFAWAH